MERCRVNLDFEGPFGSDRDPVSDIVARVEGYSLRPSWLRVVGPENVLEPDPILASDDVALFLNHAPGCYFNVGAADALRGFEAPHHHPRFDIAEESLAMGATVLAEAALRYLTSE